MFHLLSSQWSVQFSHSVVSDSLRPHRLKHARLPGPSQTLRACSNSCPSSRWYHPIILSSVVPFSFCLQSFQASGYFSNESYLHIRWSKYCRLSYSIRTSNEISGLISFRIDWFDLLAVQRTLKSLLQHHSSKASALHAHFLYGSTLTSYMNTGKTIDLTRWTFVGKVMSLFFKMMSAAVAAAKLLQSCLTLCQQIWKTQQWP